MNEARRTLRVTCAVVIDGDRILVTQRGERMKMPLKWEFPGGKVEDDEGDEACLHRELKEELDIGIRIITSLPEQRFSYTEFDITLVPFLVNITEGEIRLREHKAFRWLTRRELIALDWAEADVPVLQEFLSTTY